MRSAALVFMLAWASGVCASPAISLSDVRRMECPPETQRVIQKALEDFEAVQSYRDPIHAKQLNPGSMLFDGGTTFWRGDGYDLEVRKRLCAIGKRKYFLYGPVITFDEETMRGGNDGGRSISDVRIHGFDELTVSLRSKEKAAEPGATDNPGDAQ